MEDRNALAAHDLARVTGGFALLDNTTAQARSVAHATVHGAFNWGGAAVAGLKMSHQLFGKDNTWSQRRALISGIHTGLAKADELPAIAPAWLRRL